MESNQRNQDSDDSNQKSDENPSLDQKDPTPIVKIEAEMKESKDFPGLKYSSSVFMKNNIILFGGEDSYDNNNNLLHIFNLKTNEWAQKELKGDSKEIPEPRYTQTANAIGGYGEFEEDENVYKIDFDTQKCQIIGQIIDPVNNHTADVYKENIYIFGGYNEQTGENTSMLQKFNLQTNKCEEIKPVGYQPEGRYGHQSIMIKDHLYIFGGECIEDLRFTYLQDMFSIDLTNNQSTQIDQHGLIPSPRSYFSFFAFDDKFYLFGGKSSQEDHQDFYAFDLRSSTWKAQETKNQKCLLKRQLHSTVAVQESSYKLKVYLVGGGDRENYYKNMNVFCFSNNKLYWVLYFLESTGIHYLPGYSLIQEIIELFE